MTMMPTASPIPRKPSELTKPISLNERSRTYVFRDAQLVICDITELIVTNSGNHRLKTKSGLMYIVRPEWLYMIIDADDWTV